MAAGDFPFQIEQPQRRGGCLSVVLAALMVLYGLAAISIAGLMLGAAQGAELPPSFTPMVAKFALGIAGGAALGAFGIWRWRRWGMYLFGASALTALGLEIHLRQPVVGAPFHVTVLLVLIVLLWGRWRHLE